MPFTGRQIVDRALTKANDSTSSPVHWPDTESLLWVNDAQRAIVSRRPQANVLTAFPTLTASSSRQTLTGLSLTTGIEVMDVVCNVNGSTRGAPIRKTQRAWLDDHVPGWHVASPSNASEYWVKDDSDPTAFWIYPHNGAKVEVIYGAIPADLAALTNNFGLPDIYAEAAQWYVLFCYFSKDITKLKSAQYAQTYYQLFLTALGIREQGNALAAAVAAARETGTAP